MLRSYVWDPTAPGGIGGLLEMKQKDTGGVQHVYDYYYDGRGNVAALTDENGNVVCEYRYEPFGGIIGRTLATGFIEQPYRFSTKYHYTSTGISNYGIIDFGYRYYVVSLGRWLTQDPIGEAGGVNLYGFVGNDGVNFVDAYGLSSFTDFLRKASLYDSADKLDYYLDKGRDAVELDGGIPAMDIAYNTVIGSTVDVAKGTVDLLRFGTGFAESHETGNQYAFWKDVSRGAGLFDLLAGAAVKYTPAGKAAPVTKECQAKLKYQKLVEEAQVRYPKLAGKIQKHHHHPKYVGGAKKGPTSAIDGAYHQLITNDIRTEFPYGQQPYDQARVMEFLNHLYETKYPLPGVHF